MRIFLTGGTGFVGQYLLRELASDKRKKILVLSRGQNKNSSNIKYIRGNLSKTASWSQELKKFNPQITIHLAWEGIPDLGIENSIKNLEQGLNLVKILSKTNCKRIVVSGSVWEYGPQKGKISEKTSAKPFML